MTDKPKVLRLRKRHEPGNHAPPVLADGERLVAAQSVTHALLAGLVATLFFAIIWAMTSSLLSRVFPWFVLLLGFLVGFVVRRGGQGLDWRFPTLAAAITFCGAIVAKIVVAAAFTAAEFETGTLRVLSAVTTMTWPVFFDEAMTAADFIYALFAAAIAAYYANRRLSRRQYQALRMWEDRHEHE